MKTNTKALLTAALCGLILPTPLFAEEKGHDHKKHAEHDHAHHEIKGPNNGKMLMAVEPHAEFFVTKDRKVRITFVNDDGKMIPAKDQTVSIICGDRSNPTRMKMEQKDGAFVSTNALPKGNDFPTVITIKTKPGEKSVREKFNLNLSDCPTCEFQEYACTCDHGEDDHEGHDH